MARISSRLLVLVLVAAAMAGLFFRRDRDRDGIAGRRAGCLGNAAIAEGDVDGCAAVRRAFRAGVSALDGGTIADPSMVWILRKLLKTLPDPALQAVVDRNAQRLWHHQTARLIHSAAPPINLRSEPLHGIAGFAMHVHAPISQPRAQAAQLIEDFLARPAQGYVLTHQLLVILWAHEQHIEVRDPTTRARAIRAQMSLEQERDHEFSDLFAERAAFLLAFDTPRMPEARRWIELIVGAQQSDGRWLDPRPSRLTFDGQDAAVMHEWTHTTSLSLTALGLYPQRLH